MTSLFPSPTSPLFGICLFLLLYLFFFICHLPTLRPQQLIYLFLLFSSTFFLPFSLPLFFLRLSFSYSFSLTTSQFLPQFPSSSVVFFFISFLSFSFFNTMFFFFDQLSQFPSSKPAAKFSLTDFFFRKNDKSKERKNNSQAKTKCFCTSILFYTCP